MTVTDVESMLESMRYRGPDHIGVFSKDGLTMGNVRLAIQGIDSSGNQPIYNEDRTVVTVFNGEIYNHRRLHEQLASKGHRFSSKTDTELLVHLYEEYGEEFAVKLNGMFAFAVFDIPNNRLILGRDRSGQKPLFLADDNGRLLFASELKAMLPYLTERRLDVESVREFLSIGYVLEPHSIIQGVRTLEPGTVEVFENGSNRKITFWQPRYDNEPFRNMDEWMEEAVPIFRSALHRHLLSDVPITVFLSGGVDSSLLTLLLAGNSTICEAYSGSFSDTPDHDEYHYARNLASACGLNCNRVDLSRSKLAEILPEYLSSLSQPSGDYSGLATFLLAKETAKDYRVVLGADGGDELFGGYPTYLMPQIRRRFGWIPNQCIKLGWKASTWFCSKQKYMALPFKLQQLSQAWGKSHAKAHFQLKCFLPDAALELLAPEFREVGHRGEQMFQDMYDRSCAPDVPCNLSSIDFATFLRSCTIPKVERNTMRFSLEARLPFLDNEIIELSLRTPHSVRSDGNTLKVPLRSLLQYRASELGLAPAPATNPRKQGFSPPLQRMLENELKIWREETLSCYSQLFVPDCYKLLESMRQRGWDTHRLDWNICILKRWTLDNKIAS